LHSQSNPTHDRRDGRLLHHQPGHDHHGDHRQPEYPRRPKGGATLDPAGFDANKKVLGRKRHILTDTLGLLLAVVVHPASVQDRDGAEAVLREARPLFPFLERVVADAGYQGST
jgi:hypothetical protein